MNVLDLSSDLMQYNDLIGDTSSISKMIGIVIIVMLIGTIVILPLFMYLKYLLDIKIVKKGTLQALNEFYNKQPVNNTVPINNQPVNNTIPISNVDNSNNQTTL